MRRLTLVVSGALALVISVGCADSGGRASGDPPADAGARDLRRAAETMLGLDSFRAVSHWSPDEWYPEGMRVEEIYTAPDRLQRRILSTPGVELIWVGETGYAAGPDRPGFYFTDTREEGTAMVFFPDLAAVLRAESVSVSDSLYSFTFPGGRGEARVSDGLIQTLSVRRSSDEGIIETRYEFSLFNEAPPVKAPPDERIVPLENDLPPCDDTLTPSEEFPAVVCDPGG